MKTTRWIAFACAVVLVSGGISFASRAQLSVQPKQLIGDWYMGTMMGFDCNLKISSAQVLTVQFGGCFHQDPPIKSQWKLDGDKIRFQNAALNKSLGSYLRVVRYKKHLVLLPERRQEIQGQHKYSYIHCFWRNTMKNGLQLPEDAPR